MNIYERYKNWKDDRRISRLEADLNIINGKKATFNPIYEKSIMAGYNPELEFTRRTLENLVWFMGNAILLRRFYKTNPELCESLSYFWKEAPNNYRKVHSGVPSLIARKMGIILFGAGYENSAEVLDDDGNPIDEQSEEVREILEKLKDNINLDEKFIEAAVTESWSGNCFFKISYDAELTDYPIIEVVDVRNARIIKERGITTGIEFCNYYTIGNQRYVHKEIYTTAEDDTSLILNELCQVNTSGEKTVPLGTIPQTRELEPEIRFEGMKGMLAFAKPNKLPNSQFPDSGYGESDFAGAYSAFDALDETLSEIFKEIRDNKTIRYIPQSMLRNLEASESSNGNDFFRYDSFITNYQKLNTTAIENSRDEISITQIADKTQQHVEKWKVALTMAINNAGLSPLALGVTGLEAINSGADSQRERNKATLETRSIKIKLWQPFIENLLKQIYMFNLWLINNGIQNTIDAIPVDAENLRISVSFGDYIADSTKERIDTWGTAKTMRVSSTEEAIRQIHPEWSEDKINNEVNIIRYENGMDTDTPTTLPELTGTEIEEVVGEETPEAEE